MQTTVINEQLNISRITHINPYLKDPVITLINPYLQDQKALQNGKFLGNRYLLGERLEAAAGEADLFYCTDTAGDPDIRFVAKIYRRNAAAKREVIEKIIELDCPYIGVCYEAGEWNGRSYEIIPYYEKGSLQGQTCSYEELRSVIIPSLNSALKELHDAGIIHKDLKPSNIMRKDNGGVAVIDFGVSSVIEEGLTMLVDKTGLTPTYSAPETFRDIFLRESDYYSLGVTIYELFTGHPPYAGLSGSDLERLVSVQKIPMPEDMPMALQDLITGLTYGDISNRRDKTNPNRRWTFEEVSRWIAGEKQPVPGKGGGLLEKQPYEFAGKLYKDLEPLAEALAMNWEAGKNELFRGNMTAYFSRVSDMIAEICQRAEERAATISGRDDLIFWETIYHLVPEFKRLYWKGMKWENLPALGRDILDDSKNGSGHVIALAGDMLEQGILNKYLGMFEQGSLNKQIKLLNELSKLYIQAFGNAQEREKYVFELGYLLSGQIVLNIDERSFYSIRDLRDYMMSLYKESFDRLHKFCQTLLDSKQELTPRFEVWLLAMGKGPEVRKWKREFGLIKEESAI